MKLSRLSLPTLFFFGACATNLDDGQIHPPEVHENASALVHEREIRASIDGATAEIALPIQKKRGEVLKGIIRLRLVDVSDSKEPLLGQSELDIAQTSASATHRIRLPGVPANLKRPDAPALVLEWRIDTAAGELRGKRSLYAALGTIEVHVRGATDVPEGGAAKLRIIARDPISRAPHAGAEVSAALIVEDLNPQAIGGGRTNDQGELDLELALPSGTDAGDVRIEVRHVESLAWTTTRLRTVRDEKIALSFDKTIYKPGQTVHLRTLALTTRDKAPISGATVLFEAQDGKGNKVFKRSTVTDEFGVASMDVPTDTEVNEGEWTFRAETAGARVEQKVPVARYNLPKLKVQISADQSFARPGETLTGKVDARYLFGLPVAGAQVALSAKLSDGRVVGSGHGTTNAEGLYAFSLQLEAVSGPKVDDASERVSIEATVTDTAEQREIGVSTLVLTKDALVLRAFAEAGALVPGVENTVFVLVSDPLGRPIVGQVEVSGAGPLAPLTTDADGFASFRFVPSETQGALTLSVVDGAQRTSQRQLALPLEPNRLLVTADKALYRAGETARLRVASPAAEGRVFVDLFRAGVSVASYNLTVTDGIAQLEVPIGPELGGVLLFDAFQLGEAGVLRAGSARVLAVREDRLGIRLVPSRETYGPGEEAEIGIEVTDAAGNPKVAALGLTAVDEAVFALGGEPRDDLYLGFSLDDRVLDPRASALGRTSAALFQPSPDAEKEKLARLLFAENGSISVVGLDYNSVREEMPKVRTALKGKVERDTMRLMRRLISLVEDGDLTRTNAPTIVKNMAQRSVDPFGQYYRAELSEEGSSQLTMTSAGADESFGTGDDTSFMIWYEFIFWTRSESIDEHGNWDPTAGPGRGEFDANAAADFGGAPAPPQAAVPEATQGASGSPPAKARTDFRETILSRPSLITDANGRARISFPLAHSITTWRLTAQGSTADGLLGTERLGFRTFQRFFVDLSLPTQLTRGDEIEIPAVVYNYLDETQDVQVTLEASPWLSILSGGTQTVRLAPSEVRSVRFRIRAEKAGAHELSLRGTAGTITDTLVRAASVSPDGTRDEQSFSDELGELASNVHSVTVPADAIEGGTRVTLSLTPGFAAQAVQGMEALIQEPGGCFEQTTSTAWPNTMVVTYLEATGQLTPEMRESAMGVVTRGYQRLLTFESPTGGFNWWGNDDPGNRILSAIMLWHLDDLESLIEIDPAVRERTLAWLLAQQESDGHWPSGDALHSGNEVLGTSDVRTTAFIAWALSHTGLANAAVEKAATWIERNPPAADDLYATALAMNALAMARPDGGETSRLLSRLDGLKNQDQEGRVKWPTEAPSWTGASGDAAAIETTGLVAYGLIKARAHPANAAGAMRFLVSNKDAVGSWYNTQATMNALRALLAAASPQGSDANGLFEVIIDGQPIEPILVSPETGDLFRRFDLTPYLGAGESSVEVRLNGTGRLTYQLTRTAYRPDVGPATSPELALQVTWPSTALAVGAPVQAAVTATYRGTGTRDQLMVRVGKAPGFSPMTEDLDAIVASGRAARYEIDAQFVTFYLMGMQSQRPRDLSMRFVPTLAATAVSPASEMYVYYEPTIRTEVAPVSFTVAP